MSFADDDEWAAFISQEEMLPDVVTTQAVSDALRGFALTLVPGWDMERLATAVRRALAISIPALMDDPDKQTSKSHVREKLNTIADLAEKTLANLTEQTDEAASWLFQYAVNCWDGEGGKEVKPGVFQGHPSDYRRYSAALSELKWLAGFLKDAAKAIESPQGPWRESKKKQLRIQRGQYLAPIFESAFGEKVTSNNYPYDAKDKHPTNFMEFYKRMVEIAFKTIETTNYTENVYDACVLHKECPAQIEGIIPGS